MKVYHQPIELIIDMPAVTSKSKGVSFNFKKLLQEAGVPVEGFPEKEVELPRISKAKTKPKSVAVPVRKKVYVKTKIKDSEANPWDIAHLSSKAIAPQPVFTEPDFLHEFVTDRNIDASYKRSKAKIGKKSVSDDSFDPDWEPHKDLIWHLGDGFSQLKSAREAVQDINYIVRIGHLDTGYNKTHVVIQDSIRKNKLQRNFVDDEDQFDAHDPYTKGNLRMPGHGTGTLGILAGAKMRLNTDDGIFNDYLGGAWFAEVVCCRIAPSVVLMKTSAFAEAINYLSALATSGTPVHVVSMSMGGAPSRAWAEAVNAAYDAGITIVTASGNNFHGVPTQHVIYPARFERVIAACGVTYDFKPYHHTKVTEMQGCYGPERHMDKALSAFTPNTPWAAGDKNRIMFSGAGTSSATPQVAAAAAIYYKKHHLQLDSLQPWQRVEAIRFALFKSASQKGNAPGPYKNYFGNGIIQAKDALKIPVNISLPKTPEDSIPWFPILTTIFKGKPSAGNKMVMFNTELAQLVFHYPELAAILDNEEEDFDQISKRKWEVFTDAVIEHPDTSVTLKKHLIATHQPAH